MILALAVVAVMVAMTSGTASANYAGMSDSFDEVRGLPGSAWERYQGHYMGGSG